MNSGQLCILQISTYDTIGGAEKVAWNLFQNYRARGYGSWLAVGDKLSDDQDVLRSPERNGSWSRLVERGTKAFDRYWGIEDMHFPGTWQILDLPRQRPNIVHAHNLHGGPRGGYFDLRALPWLSRQVPLVLTLHDAWLLSGHCAHSLKCERWKTGCGHCPDLTLDPGIERDASAFNWRRKREIFARSRVYVATPSYWLMRKVEQSMLMPGVLEARVIPNGVDLSAFRPADKHAVRDALGIPRDAIVLLFTAYAVRRNRWKDYQTIQAAVAETVERLKGQNLYFIALGEGAADERIGDARVRFVPHLTDVQAVASYYQAADVYIHAAHADTFPNTILEALACGTPVVATAVGGIPEQVEDGRTGFLVPAGDAGAMADRITRVVLDADLARRMAWGAVETARREFDLCRQVDTYLAWYHALVNQHDSIRSH